MPSMTYVKLGMIIFGKIPPTENTKRKAAQVSFIGFTLSCLKIFSGRGRIEKMAACRQACPAAAYESGMVGKRIRVTRLRFRPTRRPLPSLRGMYRAKRQGLEKKINGTPDCRSRPALRKLHASQLQDCMGCGVLKGPMISPRSYAPGCFQFATFLYKYTILIFYKKQGLHGIGSLMSCNRLGCRPPKDNCQQ
jgi:hypothetical protein